MVIYTTTVLGKQQGVPKMAGIFKVQVVYMFSKSYNVLNLNIYWKCMLQNNMYQYLFLKHINHKRIVIKVNTLMKQI